MLPGKTGSNRKQLQASQRTNGIQDMMFELYVRNRSPIIAIIRDVLKSCIYKLVTYNSHPNPHVLMHTHILTTLLIEPNEINEIIIIT